MSIGEDLTHAVALEIGPDISYVRLKEGAPEGTQYLTGIEVALFLALGVLSAFFEGGVKALGEGAGEGVTKVLLDRLKRVRLGLSKTDLKNSAEIQKEASRQQPELDNICAEALPKLQARTVDDSVELLEETTEIETYLETWGFPEGKRHVVAERIVKRIRRQCRSIGR